MLNLSCSTTLLKEMYPSGWIISMTPLMPHPMLVTCLMGITRWTHTTLTHTGEKRKGGHHSWEAHLAARHQRASLWRASPLEASGIIVERSQCLLPLEEVDAWSHLVRVEWVDHLLMQCWKEVKDLEAEEDHRSVCRVIEAWAWSGKLTVSYYT